MKVGDLVRYKNGNPHPVLFLILEIYPFAADGMCVKVISTDGKRSYFSFDDLTLDFNCHTERYYESRNFNKTC